MYMYGPLMPGHIVIKFKDENGPCEDKRSEGKSYSVCLSLSTLLLFLRLLSSLPLPTSPTTTPTTTIPFFHSLCLRESLCHLSWDKFMSDEEQ